MATTSLLALICKRAMVAYANCTRRVGVSQNVRADLFTLGTCILAHVLGGWWRVVGSLVVVFLMLVLSDLAHSPEAGPLSAAAGSGHTVLTPCLSLSGCRPLSGHGGRAFVVPVCGRFGRVPGSPLCSSTTFRPKGLLQAPFPSGHAPPGPTSACPFGIFGLAPSGGCWVFPTYCGSHPCYPCPPSSGLFLDVMLFAPFLPGPMPRLPA